MNDSWTPTQRRWIRAARDKAVALLEPHYEVRVGEGWTIDGFQLVDTDGFTLDCYPYEPRFNEASWGVFASLVHATVEPQQLALTQELFPDCLIISGDDDIDDDKIVLLDSSLDPFGHHDSSIDDDEPDALHRHVQAVYAQARDLQRQLLTFLGGEPA